MLFYENTFKKMVLELHAIIAQYKVCPSYICYGGITISSTQEMDRGKGLADILAKVKTRLEVYTPPCRSCHPSKMTFFSGGMSLIHRIQDAD